jgi:hypothetical protein
LTDLILEATTAFPTQVPSLEPSVAGAGPRQRVVERTVPKTELLAKVGLPMENPGPQMSFKAIFKGNTPANYSTQPLPRTAEEFLAAFPRGGERKIPPAQVSLRS